MKGQWAVVVTVFRYDGNEAESTVVRCARWRWLADLYVTSTNRVLDRHVRRTDTAYAAVQPSGLRYLGERLRDRGLLRERS